MKKTYLNTLTPEEIIKRLKDGEFIRREDKGNKYFYKMIDGVIVLINDEDIIIGGSLTIDIADDYYFEEKEPFIITKTGVYKTRNNKNAYVYSLTNKYSNVYPILYAVDGIEHTASIYGRCVADIESEFDIVSKWED